MSLFRGDRAFSPLLRHDPFTPFFPRSSFHSPLSLSRVFDSSPYYSSFSPFVTVYEQPRTQRYDESTRPSHKAVEASSQPKDSSKSPSPQSQAKDVTHSGDEKAPERGHSGDRRQHRHSSRPQQQQMSLWSPFTGSPFNSSFLNQAFAPLTPLTHAVRALPEISLDMFSTPQAYSIHAAVPGMDKKDIQVTVEDGVLTIQAERRESRGPAQKTPATSSPSSASTQAGSSSTAINGATGTQADAEMKYATEEKEEKAASPSTQTSSAASSTPASGESKHASASATSSVATAGSSHAVVEDEDVDFHHVESFYGRVERSVQLPEDARVEELTAHYENGILKIDIPRVQEQKTRGRRIEIQ